MVETGIGYGGNGYRVWWKRVSGMVETGIGYGGNGYRVWWKRVSGMVETGIGYTNTAVEPDPHSTTRQLQGIQSILDAANVQREADGCGQVQQAGRDGQSQ